MRKSFARYSILTVILTFAVSCENLLMRPEPIDSPVNNFQVLWENLDRNYSFFTYKEVNWDSVYEVYYPCVHERLHDTALFRILGEMMLSLKDMHTDIWSPHGKIFYDNTDEYPSNFSQSILNTEYLGNLAGSKEGIRYKVIDSIGYLYIQSFSPEITDQGFMEIIDELSDVKGYIVDVRNNNGGNSNYSLRLARHFFDSLRLVEIDYFKSGPEHDDFRPVDRYIGPGESPGIIKPTVVLTNRHCFSAANSFVCWMSALPHVQIIGDTTGGGGGTPHFSELPNGWGYRYSSNQSYRPDGLNLDLGIPPDLLVYQKQKDTRRFEDTLLKYALKFLNDSKK